MSRHHFQPLGGIPAIDPAPRNPPVALPHMLAQMGPASVRVVTARTRILMGSALSPVKAMNESILMVAEKPHALSTAALCLGYEVASAHARWIDLTGRMNHHSPFSLVADMAALWHDYMDIPRRAMMPIYDRLMHNVRRLAS